MRLTLVRHGRTVLNDRRRVQGRTDVPLDEVGRRQARALAGRLAQRGPFDGLVTSDLSRAVETAAVIGKALGLEPVTDPAWRECDLGTWEGKTAEEIEALSPTRTAEGRLGLDARPHGGESRRQLQRRVVAAAEDLARRFPQGSLLVVTHSGPIWMLVGHALALDEAGLGALVADNASIHRLEVAEGVWRVLGLNDTCHLRERRPPASPAAP